jgi:hypothetical protein
MLHYHAGVPLARGGYVGADVFFVISGFLIIGLLVRELEKTDGISLSFYSSSLETSCCATIPESASDARNEKRARGGGTTGKGAIVGSLRPDATYVAVHLRPHCCCGALV